MSGAGSVGTRLAFVNKTLRRSCLGCREASCVIRGVVVCVYIVVVEGETMRPRATIIRVEDNEVNYLLAHRALKSIDDCFYYL